MKMTHQLVGYDRDSEHLAVEYDIPAGCFAKVGAVVGVLADDPELVGSYALIPDQVVRIANILRQRIDCEKFDFFIEPSD